MAKPIVLIHGAWHAKWCWNKVIPLLAKHNHPTINIDLPGHGTNQADFREITLNTYVDYVAQVLKELGEPAVLVGHSFAGVTMSQVAEMMPHTIDRLIYVTAIVPKNGESLMYEAGLSKSQAVANELLTDIKNNESELKMSERLDEIFYNQCKIEDILLIKKLLQREPYRPLTEAINVTESKFGKVKKVYIACENDNSVPIEDQKRMYIQHGIRACHIRADHSPFYSTPDELTEVLVNCFDD
jgi:esterase/lipase